MLKNRKNSENFGKNQKNLEKFGKNRKKSIIFGEKMAEKKKICQANNHTGQNNRTGKTFFQNLINVHTEIRVYRREKVLKKNKHTGSFIQESRVVTAF